MSLCFVLMNTATPSPKPSRISLRTPRRSQHHKRRRASSLSRKYRVSAPSIDDELLISDPSAPSHITCQRPPLDPAYFSRFPSSWQEAKTQAISSVTQAVAEGHEQIRLDIKRPQRFAQTRTLRNDPHAVGLLVDAACDLIRHLRSLDHDDPRNFGMDRKIHRAVIHFNDEHAASIGRDLVHSDLRECVDLHVLGDGLGGASKDTQLHVMLAPSNRDGNPGRIEDVQAVHYSYWRASNVVVMINPSLMALTKYSATSGNIREPGFLSDYLPSYYVDPVAFPAETATGAVLRCFPRKWELYLLKLKEGVGFRLISEQKALPEEEMLKCLFAWRVKQELGAPISV